MKLKSNKILLGLLLIFVSLTLIIVGWFLFGNKPNTAEFVSWKLPGISQIGIASTPGKIFAPKTNDQAKILSADKITEWTNKYREDENLAPLAKNDTLTKAANEKVVDMFEKQYFDHISPDGTTPAELVLNTGYNYKITGENLALGGFKDEKDLVDAWMASPGHRANILNPEYKEIGVASDLKNYENQETWISVQEFGTQAPNCSKPDKSMSTKIDSIKTEYQTLESQMKILISEAQSLSQEANEKIKEGNDIYKETGKKSKAEPYWDEGQALREQSQTKIEEARKIDQQLNELYNIIQALTTKYNSQVNIYNQCIKN